MGERGRENLISGGLVLYTVHAQYGSIKGVDYTSLLHYGNQRLSTPP